MYFFLLQPNKIYLAISVFIFVPATFNIYSVQQVGATNLPCNFTIVHLVVFFIIARFYVSCRFESSSHAISMSAYLREQRRELYSKSGELQGKAGVLY